MSENDRPRPRAFRLDQIEDAALEPQSDFTAQGAPADPDERAAEAAQSAGFFPRRKIWSWGGLLVSALGALASFAFGLWLDSLVETLFAKSMTLGWIGVGLAGLVVFALLMLIGREIRAILRQRAIAQLHRALALAHEDDDDADARKRIAELARLYAHRPETARARQRLEDLRGEILDGVSLIEIAESALMPRLDSAVRREIAQAARAVSLVTALAPRAIVDVVFVAAQALRLIRRIAEIYGGRPGLLGAFRLARAVGAHLALTGSMALGDPLLQQIVGHGVAARISSRLGEGVLNGLLTARIGLSAMAVCRPMPFVAQKPPGIADVAPFLFGGEKDGKG
jgi:putative membrane protein